MEPEVWVIVTNSSYVSGHGETTNEKALAYPGYDENALYPAFTSKHAAKSFISNLPFKGMGLRVQRLELREE